jgi:hypothetical protein
MAPENMFEERSWFTLTSREDSRLLEEDTLSHKAAVVA